MKKIKLLFIPIIIIIAVCGSAFFADAQDRSYVLGDSDGDGFVRISDATTIQKSLACFSGFELEPGTIRFLASDTDCNGGVTIADATNIQRYLAMFQSAADMGIGADVELPATQTDENEPDTTPPDESQPVITVPSPPTQPTPTKSYETPERPLLQVNK